jgi:hypothetical protein
MKLRASSLPALSKCGGWKSKPFDTSLTLMGTARHDALEALVKNNDRTLIDALPAAEAEGVEWAADIIRVKASDSHPMEWESPGALEADDVKVTGQWDLVNGSQGFDLKNQIETAGRSYEPQMAVYALMAMDRGDLDSFDFHLLYAAPKILKTITFTRAQAERIISDVVDNVIKGELQPNSYCGWCNRAATCPAMNETASKISEGLSTELEAYDPKNLADPINLNRALTLSRALRPWMEEVERMAKEHCISGGALDGFELKQRALPAKVKDLNEAFNAVDLSATEFMGACSLTLGKLYDTYANAKGVKKAEAKRTVQALLADVFLPTAYTQSLTKSK